MRWILLLSLASGQHVMFDDLPSEGACRALGNQLAGVSVVSGQEADAIRSHEIVPVDLAGLVRLGPAPSTPKPPPRRVDCLLVK